MAKELWEIIGDFFRQMLHSRLFPLALVFMILFSVLIGRLFHLQIVNAEEYQENYVQKTLADLPLSSMRGCIYDCNGKLLAGNELMFQVTFRDTGAYKTHQTKNTAAWQIVQLMDSVGETIDMSLPIQVNDQGEYEFSTQSQARIKRFLIDLLGRTYIDEQAKKGVDVYSWTASEVVDYMKKKYYFNRWTDADKNVMNLSNQDNLSVLNIRYKLTLTAYSKYQSVLISDDVSQETVAATLEYASTIEGLNIQENVKRIYPYGKYCSAIIGYTKSADEEELAALQEAYPDAGYTSGDIIGKGGIEENMEYYLQGTKGSQTVYLDSQGQILSVVSRDEPVQGNDVYLSIDIDRTIGIYNLMERMIAGILLQHLVNHDVTIEEQNPEISVKDVYANLIVNNALDLNAFADTDASDTEHAMYAAYQAEYDQAIAALRDYLISPDAPAYNQVPDSMKIYLDYIYEDLLTTDWGVLDTSRINKSDDVYVQWKNGETSLRALLVEGITSGWINMSEIETDNRYSSAEQIYQNLVENLLLKLEGNKDFDKLIYQYLIQNNVISGNQVCLALFDQGVLPYDQASAEALAAGNAQTAFDFIYDQIYRINITPEQLALDPCSGAVVVTDVDTGKVLTIISYPSYDNNYFSGTVDAAYYNSLLDNKSLPLFNRATQTTIAPGSTFKMVSMVAGLEENVITPSEMVNCTVLYEKVSPAPSCWNKDGHGWVDMNLALAGSCNYYFYEIGYRLSMTETGVLNSAQGVSTLAKYVEMLGLGEKTGIEIAESTPHISDTEAIASAIGQGTHAYSTVGLSRYVTTLASSGNVYRLSLLDSVQSQDGTMIEKFDPEIRWKADLPDNVWSLVQNAMRSVVATGSITGYLDKSPVQVAAKTGTAQEDLTRSEHAQFVSFAPYDDPEITVTITIPNGYTSGNNAHLAEEIYQFWYGDINNADILAMNAYELNDGSAVVED